jgi:hypothetical protein
LLRWVIAGTGRSGRVYAGFNTGFDWKPTAPDLPAGGKIDGTEKVAELVKDDALSVEASNDRFTDPAEGVAKTPKVDYTFDAKGRSKTVGEGETLTISSIGEGFLSAYPLPCRSERFISPPIRKGLTWLPKF